MQLATLYTFCIPLFYGDQPFVYPLKLPDTFCDVTFVSK